MQRKDKRHLVESYLQASWITEDLLTPDQRRDLALIAAVDVLADYLDDVAIELDALKRMLNDRP